MQKKKPVSVRKKSDTPVTMGQLTRAVREALEEARSVPETYAMPGVAKFFGVHVQTPRKWHKRGILPDPAIKVGRVVRWSRAQLEAVLAKGVQA
jgi:hypothetical protein